MGEEDVKRINEAEHILLWEGNEAEKEQDGRE